MAAAAVKPETPGTGTDVARIPEHPIVTLLDREEARRRILPMLAGQSYERVMVEAYLAVRQNPELAQCTADSLIQSVARAVSTGGTIGRDVHLVPFNVNVAPQGQPKKYEKRAQAIEDYKFIVELMLRTGGAMMVSAKLVFEHEPFKHHEGTRPSIEHSPIMDPAKRGKLIGAYAYAIVRHSLPPVIHVMSVAEIDAIRQQFSKQWKNGAMPDWYPLKTCLRKLQKLVPTNPRLAKLLQFMGTGEPDDILPALPAPSMGELPAAEQRSINYALPPRGTQLPPGGYDYDCGTEQRTPDVPARVATDPRSGTAAAQHAATTPEPYGFEPDAPHPAETQAAEFDFKDDGPLPHEMADDRDADASPLCPKCGKAMHDQRATKSKPTQPDFRCVDAPRRRGEPGCEGVLWSPR
ncbi:MAG: recombinase RecT [Gemmatimonadaceae bacterium]|nr:recombinase RecT [Gemmatimonadaceae bacterium]